MKKIFTFVLLCVAIAVSAQDISFKKTEELFTDKIPLNEMRSIESSIDDDGQGIITVESKNGAIYSCPVDDIEFSNEAIDAILSTPRFAGMTKVKEYQNFGDLELGDLVGVFHEEDYDLDTFIGKSYAILKMLGASILDIVSAEMKLKTGLLAVSCGAKTEDIRIHIADIIYVGEDVSGNKIPLSARLIYPYNTNKNNLSVNKIYIENHVTIFQKNAEPTSAFSTFTSSGVCTNGYLVIQPDLLGWGSTRQCTQMYIDKEINGSAIAYSVVASQQFAEWSQTRDTYGIKIANNAGIINAGSSQGASSALSGTYYIENILDKSRYKIPELTETRLCAGAYNMKLCMDKFCELDDMIYACKMPMLIAGAFAAHADEFAPYTIHDYFNPLMKTYFHSGTDKTTGEPIPYGTPWQILDLKIQGSFAVEGALSTAFPSDVTPKTPSLKKMMSSELIKTGADGNYLDWENPKMVKLEAFLQKHNFASKDIWTPKAKIELLHAKNDDIIPFETAEEFYNNQNYRNGMSNVINFTQLDEVPSIMSGSYAVHMVTCFVWLLSEVSGLPASTINELLKSMLANADQK